MILISSNDIDQIKESQLKESNLNFLEPFADKKIDDKISPLILACFLGRVEIVKLLLENISIDIDFPSQGIEHTPLTIAC